MKTFFLLFYSKKKKKKYCSGIDIIDNMPYKIKINGSNNE